MQANDATVEWTLLQNQCDSYEKFSLVIKLTALTLFTLCAIDGLWGIIPALIMCALWLQDAIWKTFQARIEVRLLELETFFCNEQTSESNALKPFQFNREYQANRGGTAGLLREYCGQAVRPTVAFPYVFLLLLALTG